MSSDEQIPVVADVENAKKSDGTSTAGEHNVDKANDDEQVPQSDEKSTTEKENGENHAETEATAIEESNDDGKVNNINKRDIDEVDKDDNDEKKNGQAEDDDEEAVVSTTTTTNKKVKIIDPLVNENGGDNDETSSTSAKVPNEELTVV